MIVKVSSDRKVTIIESIRPEEEELFIKVNSNAGYMRIDSLPPSRYGKYKLDENNNVIVDIEEELKIAKREKREKLKRSVETFRAESGYMYPDILSGKAINAREKDLINLQALLISMNEGDTIHYRTYDNDFVEITKEQVQQLLTELIEFGKSLYRWKWSKEEEILNAGSLEELDNIDIEITDELVRAKFNVG